MHVHLNDDQKAMLKQVIACYAERPTYAEYDRWRKVLLGIKAPDYKKKYKLPNTVQGFEPKDVQLLAGFRVEYDLPAGLALISRYDSRGNWGIANAAEVLWAHLWNYWGSPSALGYIAKCLG